PAEHLALPDEKDVCEGVRATRLAVRVGDVAKYPDRRDNEKAVARARRDMRWIDLEEHLMFPEVARKLRQGSMPEKHDTCTMCGDFCAMKKGKEVFQNDITGDKLSSSI
ncbi:MAG: thiamine biosynthesis protein ThiC, partial [Candidatus Electrothrix sp. AR4]|nr:thiamine biosynthesis protein ThiC [Candidatus Electrothrix sp. AR4]